MSYAEFIRLNVVPPYVVERESPGDGSILYFGTHHTGERDDPQLATLVTMWDSFRPTVAFTEGGDWPLAESKSEAIEKYGECGLFRFLADRDGVPVRSLEPEPEVELAELLKSYSAEQIKVFYVLRGLPQFFRLNSGKSFDDYLAGSIRHYSESPPLAGPPRTISEFEASLSRVLPELEDVRAVSSDWTSPLEQLAFTNEIAREVGRLRDRAMVCKIVETARAGQRVFAVAGLTHVAMQEPVLQAALASADSPLPRLCRPAN